MAERDRAAVDVQAVGIHRQLFQAGEHLRGERFIQLDEIDLIEREAGQFQRLADRGHRSDAEPLGFDAGGRERDEAAQRRQPGCARAFGGCDDDRGRAVAGLRRVARRHAAPGVEGGTQLRERLERRVAPRPLVDRVRELPGFRFSVFGFGIDQRRRDRHDLVGESAGVDRRQRALMTAERERVLLGARNAGLARVVFRDEPG